MTTHKKQVQEFWNERAQYGQNAGTNDFMLKHLEEAVLLERIPPGADVLDIGCGNGSTLIRLVKEKGCTGTGLDYAEGLLDLARQSAEGNGVQEKLRFAKRDVLQLGDDPGRFQHIMTQRCLINLETEEEQKCAFASILQLLRPGGHYYMIEAFNDGNRALNALRDIFHLEPMTSPWHNRFLELKDVLNWEKSYPVVVEEVSHFASTYYFLSRVVYAKLAADRGEPLRYDSDINQLSLRLPPIGEFGATKLIVWRKVG
jgi:ubiquinone/menaquinone biosynthesis C-methylase UbiE